MCRSVWSVSVDEICCHALSQHATRVRIPSKMLGMLGGLEVSVHALLCSLDHIQSNWHTCNEQGKHLCQSRVD